MACVSKTTAEKLAQKHLYEITKNKLTRPFIAKDIGSAAEQSMYSPVGLYMLLEACHVNIQSDTYELKIFPDSSVAYYISPQKYIALYTTCS